MIPTISAQLGRHLPSLSRRLLPLSAAALTSSFSSSSRPSSSSSPLGGPPSSSSSSSTPLSSLLSLLPNATSNQNRSTLSDFGNGRRGFCARSAASSYLGKGFSTAAAVEPARGMESEMDLPTPPVISEPYIVMIRLLIKENYLDKFIEAAVQDASGSVLEEEGCRRFDVIQDWNAGNAFAFCEVYNDREAFDNHVTTPHFLKFHRIVRPIQIEEPEVAFCRLVHPADGNFDSFTSDAELYADFGSLFIRHASYSVKRASLAEFLSLMLAEAHEASAMDGCFRYDVFQNLENPSELFSYEVYRDKAAFTDHMSKPSAEKRKERAVDVCVKPAHEIVGRNVWPPDSWNFSSEN